MGLLSDELHDDFGGDPLLEKLDGGLPSAVDVRIADVLGNLTEAGIDDVFKYFGPLRALTRLDDTVVEGFPVYDDGTEETDDPPNGPLGESDEMPGVPVEVEADPTLVDSGKLAVTFDEMLDAELEPGICVEIDELLEDSTDADGTDELWLRGADVELDGVVVDEGGLDVPVASEPDADEDVAV